MPLWTEQSTYSAMQTSTDEAQYKQMLITNTFANLNQHSELSASLNVKNEVICQNCFYNYHSLSARIFIIRISHLSISTEHTNNNGYCILIHYGHRCTVKNDTNINGNNVFFILIILYYLQLAYSVLVVKHLYDRTVFLFCI